MASTPASNGSYLQNADPQNFPANPTAAATSTYQPMGSTTPQSQQQQQTQSSAADLPKDEVGWYFVEQYYTTLNKTPDRLHLFYTKRSSFVWGTEGESLPLAHGRQEIQQKIAAHEFKDCKVRVSNVDSQGSAGNGIVIQVLGEMSNNGLPNRKFAQTFFLAEQPNGYYVLNDMFRYLKDDDDIEEGEYEYQGQTEEAAEAAQEVIEEVAEAIQDMTVTETHTVEVDVGEGETIKVEESRTVEPEEVVEAIIEEVVAAANGDEVEAAAEPEAETPAPEPEAAAPQVEEAQPEPAAPEPAPPVEKAPTPAPAPKEPERAPAPAPAPVPTRPKTWASLVAASKTAAPAAAAAAAAATPAAQQPAPTVSTQAAPAQQAAAAPSPATPSTPTTSSGGSQWQPVEKKGRNVPQQAQTAQTQAYVKNVTETVSHQALKDALSKFGNIKHFEVNKQKNCAFVDFETPSGFAAARAASPVTVDGVNIVVEERRPRGPVNGSFGRGPQRGGYGGRDGQGRGGPPRGGARGGYPPRGGFRTNTPGA